MNNQLKKNNYILSIILIVLGVQVFAQPAEYKLTASEYVEHYKEGELHDIPGYYVTVQGDYNQFTKSRAKTVFSPKTKTGADKVLKEWKAEAVADKSKKSWQAYYKIKNSLADLRPPFAGTTHKAQGGTFPAVFIDKLNINKCKNRTTRARLFYVALTRASENVYINS